MSRADRIAKKQKEAEMKKNTENRLPASIHQLEDGPEEEQAVNQAAGGELGVIKLDSVEPNSLCRSKTFVKQTPTRELNFDVMDDPDYPADAVNSNIIVEEIEMNGRVQKIYKKTYELIDGKTINITRMEQA